VRGNRNVWVLATSVGLFIGASSTWERLLPLYLRDLGASDFQVACGYALTLMAFFVLQWVGGRLADRYGRRTLIIWPGLISSLCYFITAAVSNWVLLVAILVILNSMSALQIPAFTVMIAESTQPGRRGRAFALFRFWMTLANAAGPALGALLLQFVNIPLLMIVTGIVGIILSGVRYWGLTETLVRREAPSGRLSLGGALVRLCLVGVAYETLTALTFRGPFISLYAADIFGYTRSQINLLFAVGPLVAGCFSFLAGRAVDTWGSRQSLAGGALVFGILAVAWLWAAPFWAAVLVVGGIALLTQLTRIAWDAERVEVASELAGPGDQGYVLGALGTVSGSIGSLSQPAAGALMPLCGPAAPFVLALGVSVFLAGITRLGTSIATHGPPGDRLPTGPEPESRRVDEDHAVGR